MMRVLLAGAMFMAFLSPAFAQVPEIPDVPTEPEVEVAPAELIITQPSEDFEILFPESYTFAATFSDDDMIEDEMQWTIYEGTCDLEESAIIYDNSDEIDFTFVDGEFALSLDLYDAEMEGDYCLLLDPTEQAEEVVDVYEYRDFSVVYLYAVGGTKYQDINENGTWDESDTVVSDWSFSARNTETGEISDAVDTDNDGVFLFYLPSGEWEIIEEDRNNWSQVTVYNNSWRHDMRILEDEMEVVAPTTCTIYVGGKSHDFYTNSAEYIEVDTKECVFLNLKEKSSGGTKVGSRSSGGKVLGASTSTVATTTTSSSTTPATPKCEMYIKDYMRAEGANDVEQVTKLQLFLNAVGIKVAVTGVFDEATTAAVREFQVKHMSAVLSPWGLTEGTGYVYKTTRAAINNTVCPGSETAPAVN